MTLEQLQNLTAEVRLARTDLTTVIVLLESLLKVSIVRSWHRNAVSWYGVQSLAAARLVHPG